MLRMLVFDIDGTLANISHRIHHIKNKPKNWKLFNELSVNDKPINHTIDLYQKLSIEHSSDHLAGKHMYITIATGRSEDYRNITEKWLKDNGINFDAVYMRKSRDYRPDYIVKCEYIDYIYNDYQCMPDIWFDDRVQVVKALRERGITVFQVANGDY